MVFKYFLKSTFGQKEGNALQHISIINIRDFELHNILGQGTRNRLVIVIFDKIDIYLCSYLTFHNSGLNKEYKCCITSYDMLNMQTSGSQIPSNELLPIAYYLFHAQYYLWLFALLARNYVYQTYMLFCMCMCMRIACMRMCACVCCVSCVRGMCSEWVSDARAYQNSPSK